MEGSDQLRSGQRALMLGGGAHACYVCDISESQPFALSFGRWDLVAWGGLQVRRVGCSVGRWVQMG